MEQRTSTGQKRGQLPVSLYPLSKKLASSRSETKYQDTLPPMEDAQPATAEKGIFPALPYEDPEEILREHLPMVRFLALRIRERLPQQVEMEDLISAGIVGLMDALQKFDPQKKVQFRTYAQFRVRGAMLDSLRALDWGPRDLRRKGRAVEEAIRSLSTTLGKAPTESEVAKAMGLDLSAYQQLLGELSGLELGSLNAAPADDAGVEVLALIPAGPEDDPFLQCQSNEMRGRLAEAIGGLPERERMVLTLYYYEELTMREVGATMGVVESRVSQLHSSAMARLRVALGAPTARRAARA
ncbi:MAG TPA: FliA/WhiG family RNA polymerase sigma factor [Acidobacteriaceae bacterium]|jgi:RNA polymerase sigma factor for flagellar operon FliA